MPQLNPEPWFLIFMLSWLIYLTILFKMTYLKTLNKPIMKNNMNLSKPWIWPWV